MLSKIPISSPSPSIKGFIGPFKCFSLSAISSIVAIWCSSLSFKGVEKSLFLPSIVSGAFEVWDSFQVVCHISSPVCQFISRLFSYSQGKPRMIFCFPNPVTSSFSLSFHPLMVMSSSTKYFMVPCLFLVPSMLKAFSGCSSFWISKPDLLA